MRAATEATYMNIKPQDWVFSASALKPGNLGLQLVLGTGRSSWLLLLLLLLLLLRRRWLLLLLARLGLRLVLL